MKKIIGIIALVLLIIAAIYGIIQVKKNTEKGKQVTKNLLTEYLTLIQNENYKEAYDKFWLESTKKEIPFAKYKKAFKDRTKKLGNLVDWEAYQYEISSNIFSSKKVYEISYFLYYDKITYKLLVRFDIIETDNAAKIEMTYQSSDNAESLYKEIF